MVVRKSIHISGSGSIYAMGYLDANYRPNMSKDECLELVKNGVAMAIARDGSSGGCIRYAVITEKGVEKNVILNNQVPRFFEDNWVSFLLKSHVSLKNRYFRQS